MKQIRVTTALLAALLLSLSAPVMAGDHSVPEVRSSGSQLTDLTLANFFSAGWGESWTRRGRTGAPDMSLLRVQTNFVTNTLRTDYFYERPLETSGERSIQYLSQLAEYAFNRRFMLAVFGNDTWIDSLHSSDEEGGTFGALARFQLIDTPHASYALNLRVASPNHGLDETQTTTGFALAGWHDLTPLGLNRVGLYWHAQEQTLIGSHRHGAKQNDFNADVAFAKTWTSPDAPLGNLSTFIEAYVRTDIDGPKRGKTFVTLIPGARFTLAHHHIFMAGIEVPVSTPRPFENIFRFTYMFTF